MDLSERLRDLGKRAVDLVGHIETEEATKTALVLPFLQELGYDVFNPAEVVPEFTADVGIKRGEKVDYAICINGDPIFLIECKPHGAKLDNYGSQLYRYFSVTTARVAILTDGLEYRFYSDLIEPNKLDAEPFLTLNITNLKREALVQVAQLSKATFDIESILASAENLRYVSQIRSRFAKELEQPSDELVRVFVDPIYSGRFTHQAVDRFRGIVRDSLRSHIADAVNMRLRAALDKNDSEPENADKPDTDETTDQEAEIVTTAEEIEGLYAVRAILRDLIEPDRVVPRDVRSYFGILLDDNNRKPICRLWFNGHQKYLGVFDEDKVETRLPVDGPNDLFHHAESIRTSAGYMIDRSPT